jgi:hypothetical protein
VQLQLHAWQALHLELLLLYFRSQNDRGSARLSRAAVHKPSMSFHAQIHACLSVRACKCTGVAAERLDMSNHRAWRCSMCKQLFDHQISKRSPLCRHLIGHGSTTQKNLVTCRDSALLSKRFVVRRLLKACRVAIADDTQSLEEVTNVFQLARLQPSELPTSVSSIFSFALGAADCHVTPQLIQKFGEDETR